MSGAAVNARFEPEIPKEEKVVSINLRSDFDLTVEKIIWYDCDLK